MPSLFFFPSQQMIIQLNTTGRAYQAKASQNLEEEATMQAIMISQEVGVNKTNQNSFPQDKLGMIIWVGMANPSLKWSLKRECRFVS